MWYHGNRFLSGTNSCERKYGCLGMLGWWWWCESKCVKWWGSTGRRWCWVGVLERRERFWRASGGARSSSWVQSSAIRCNQRVPNTCRGVKMLIDPLAETALSHLHKASVHRAIGIRSRASRRTFNRDVHVISLSESSAVQLIVASGRRYTSGDVWIFFSAFGLWCRRQSAGCLNPDRSSGRM